MNRYLVGSATLLGVGVWCALALAGLESSGREADEERRVRFGRDVRPILVKSCLACHGFDPSTREAGLRLDVFEGATAARGPGKPPAIVPGDPDSSVLLERVAHPDPGQRMPPEGEALSAGEIETLRAWIEQGAEYEAHWSFSALEPVEPPESGKHPVDAFIDAGLASAGLAAAPRADRRALLRRLSFDLTGLPPTPEQTEAFVGDERPGAYGRLVDELLSSPRFGERWARHWLDLVRYAETYAHEFDYPIRHAWQYRDYVIRAFNADVPYDRFVREHIAGDVLSPSRRHPERGFNESILGTGFWWLSQGTHAPVDVVHDESERLENQIDVMTKTFLATTVACARCHDHKFDPVTTKEYYGLAAFVQSSRRQEAYLDPDGAIGGAVARMRSLASGVREGLGDGVWAGREEGAISGLLVGVGEVLFGEASEGESTPDPARVLADFDGPDYEGWTVEGDAFTDSPTPAGDDPLSAEGTATGAGFANTHRRLEGEGSVEADRRTGRIVSEPFVIDRDFLHVLIGGGHHPGRTGLRVLVGGETVGELTGHNSLRLRPERLDLSAHRGREARIEVFDEVTGGWGNIRVDQITLSDEPSAALPASRRVEVVADGLGLDEDRLRAWVRAVQADWPDGLPPTLGRWLEVARDRSGRADAPWPEEPASAEGEADPAEAGWLFDFGRPGAFERWRVSGWAFGGSVTEPGEWRLGAGVPALASVRAADSGRLADGLMGTMRGPTFVVEAPYLAVRARGRGTVRIIVHGYTMDEYNPLLWPRVKLDVDSPGWGWRVHDLRKWVGLRAHYEIIDDSQSGAIEVAEAVWMREDRPPGRPAEPAATAEGGAVTLADAAGLIGRRAGASLSGSGVGGAAEVNWMLSRGLLSAPRAETLEALRAEQRGLPAPMRAMAMEDGPGRDGRVYVRGDHRQLGEAAPRAFLAAMVDEPSLAIGEGSGRLALAEKLLDRSNPFPARVMVNRVWHHLMGRGLVETVDDFGLLGASPSHPELLDHLAWRFREEMGWSVKALIREIVTSEAYRRASGPLSADAGVADPRNALWSVREVRRLDGESIRDAILAVSGELDTTMYGPSVPVHLTGFMTGRGRPGRSGPLDGDGRRSVYLEVRRNFLSPMMQAFDMPNPHSTVGKRNESNVPAQSLILLNDPFVAEQADRLAERLLAAHAEPGVRVEALYLRALARRPSALEAELAEAFVRGQAEAMGASDWRSDRQAWADLCHVVFNLREFSFVE